MYPIVIKENTYDLEKLTFEDYKSLIPGCKKSDYNQLFKDAGLPLPEKAEKEEEPEKPKKEAAKK